MAIVVKSEVKSTNAFCYTNFLMFNFFSLLTIFYLPLFSSLCWKFICYLFKNYITLPIIKQRSETTHSKWNEIISGQHSCSHHLNDESEFCQPPQMSLSVSFGNSNPLLHLKIAVIFTIIVVTSLHCCIIVIQACISTQ